MWQHILNNLSWKYVNTAEIIRKVTMYLKETHIMLVAFWWTLVKIVVVSRHKRQRNKGYIFRYREALYFGSLWISLNLFHDLFTIWKHQLGLESARAALCKWLLLGVRLHLKNFCELAKQAETIRNYQKQVLVMINYLANSQINSIPE